MNNTKPFLRKGTLVCELLASIILLFVVKIILTV